MINLKSKAVTLAAVLAGALTLGLGVLTASTSAQAQALTPSRTMTVRSHPAAARAHILGSFDAVTPNDFPLSGTFAIQNYQSGWCVGIQGGSKTPGTDAVQWNCNGHPDQIWHVGATYQGFHQLVNNDGVCLGIAGGSNAEGSNLVAWNCLGSNHEDQYWYQSILETCGGSAHPIANLLSPYVIGTQGGSLEEGVPLVMWKYQAVCNNQYWYT